MIGLEQENRIVYATGKNAFLMAPDASRIVNDPANPGCYVKEIQKDAVETNFDPQPGIRAVHSNYRRQSHTLDVLAAQHNRVIVPGGRFGEISPRNNSPRYDQYTHTLGRGNPELGEQRFSQLLTGYGVHALFDAHPDEVIRSAQRRFHLAFAPLAYALTSTSPFNDQGANHRNNHRTYAFRKLFAHLPILTKTMRYPKNDRDNAALDQEAAEVWAKANNTTVEANTHFPPQTVGYRMVRTRTDIAPGKVLLENRAFDTSFLPYLTTAVALLYAGHQRIAEEGIPVKEAKPGEPFSFTEREIIVPNIRDLWELETRAEYGLHDEKVLELAHAVYKFAKGRKAANDDKEYLKPLDLILETKLNPADLIVNQLVRNTNYRGRWLTPLQIRIANGYVHGMHQRGLESDATEAPKEVMERFLLDAA